MEYGRPSQWRRWTGWVRCRFEFEPWTISTAQPLDDTPDKIDYDRLARVVAGLEAVVGELASGE